MASENVSKTVSLKDYIIDMQSAAVKGSAQYEVVLENNTDFIIKRRTATTDRELVIPLLHQGLQDRAHRRTEGAESEHVPP